MKISLKLIAILFLIVGIPDNTFAQTEISSQETEFLFRGEQASRAHNVRLAASRIDGIVLRPGQEFSYNEIVGPRTHRAGFREAHVIQHGRLVDDWGGGACQVAGTLHAAVLRAGLEILEERPHSRISSYLDPGYDTTVVYGRIDFRFRNNTSAPITLRVFERVQGVLRVEILGQPTTNFVQIMVEELERRPFRVTSYRDCRRVRPGRRDIIERGTPFLRILRRRIVGDRVEEVRMTYPSSRRIVRFCPIEED